MFDGQDKSLFFIGLLLAGFISIAGQSRAPDIDMDVAVDTAVLPAVPLTAGPDGTPAQVAVARQTVDLGGGFFATLMYGYALEGVVVTRRQFRWDATSPVSPLDLGIVWGDLADPGATAEVSFRTGQRAVFYRADPGAVLPPRWEEQITNNHLIPATPEVHAALMAVAPGYRVRLRGYLVTVTGEAIRPWRSSTRRDDNTIIGGCEIILVREVEVLPPAEA
jgi:hypothetical protein